MTLQLTGLSEQLPIPYREFYGEPRLQMHQLVSGKDEKGNQIDVPRKPLSWAGVIDRRENAPRDVRTAWQKNYIFTGDGSTAGSQGDHLIVLDAQPLREMTAESDVYQGAVVLPHGVWDGLKAQKEGVLYLSADEVQEAQGRGYMLREMGFGLQPTKQLVKSGIH